MDLDRELSIATNLAKQAGVIALDARKHLMVSYKSHGQGPVTNVDHAVDSYLCAQLQKAFPDDLIISEESNDEPREPIGGGRVWFIDPIDGTTALVAGTDDFVVMIGLAIDGVARLGVVYQPTTDILWRGIVGQESRAERIERNNHQPLTLKKSPLHSGLTIIASISHKSLRQRAMLKVLNPQNIIYRSSIGLKAMLILDGEADFYVAWSQQIKLWDTCGPAAIIAAASGHISLIDNQPLQFAGSISHDRPIVIARCTPDEKLYAQLAEIESG